MTLTRLLGATALVLAAPLVLAPATATPAPAASRPSTYVVSDDPDTFPEGIHVSRDGTMYVTSKGTGTVYRGDVRSRRMRPWLPGGADGRVTATGVHEDPWGRVLVAGAESRHLFLYDRRGRLLAKRTTAEETFLNDFAFSGGHVYVTDSFQQTIYRATLTRRGLGKLEPWMTIDRFSVAPEFLNGIVATPDGTALLVADWQAGRTFRVDLRRRTGTPIRVVNGTVGGDGLLLDGRTLWAVDNVVQGDGSLVTSAKEVRLNGSWTEGRILDVSEPAGPERQPTTIARDGHRLLWVESQFGAVVPEPPFVVTEVDGLCRHHSW